MAEKEETFLLVSLEEEKAKKLAQVISNDSCRKILDYLAKKKATETELSQQLNVPLSTVHYNIRHLVDNKLVEAEEFHYSEKGREVLHYSLSNKYVIIAPKGVSEKFRDKLKSILPVIGIIGAISIALQFISSLFAVGVSKAAETARAPLMEKAALGVSEAAIAQQAVDHEFTPYLAAQPIGLWFALGAVLCLSIYLLFEYLRKKYKQEK